MFYFIFVYEDGTFVEYEHVIEASYNGRDTLVVVSGEQLLSHRFPVEKSLWLRTDNGMLSISSVGLRSVEVRKE